MNKINVDGISPPPTTVECVPKGWLRAKEGQLQVTAVVNIVLSLIAGLESMSAVIVTPYILLGFATFAML